MNLIEAIKKEHDIKNAIASELKGAVKNSFTVQFCLQDHYNKPTISLAIVGDGKIIDIAQIHIADEIDIHADVDTDLLRRILEHKLTSISI